MRHFAWVLALLCGSAFAQGAIPPVARVTDQTATLSEPQRAALEQRLAAFEQAKGSQVVVLIVPTTQPETIEQYGIRVADAWKLGRKGVDDGAILIVAKDDRALRIEVGYGLEGALPDAVAKRIVDEVIVPRFRDGDFAGGVEAGVDRMLKVIEGEPLPPPQAAPASRVSGTMVENMFGVGLFALFVSQALGSVIGKFPSAAGVAGLFGVVAWLVFGIAAIGVFAGVVLFIVSLAAQLGGMGRRGGWSTGGGGFRGGGGFGGGFRGGGGGFGGGGASGRW